MKATSALLWIVLLASCATDKKQKVAREGPKFETWCAQSKLGTASAADEAEAKASEVEVRKLTAQFGGGLSVRIQLGTNIKDGSSYSTTSFYELRDSKGTSLAKFPSRMSLHGFEGYFRLWCSADHSLILVYEWIKTGVDSHEMHFAFCKEEDCWNARSIKIPKFYGPSSNPSVDDFRHGPGNTGPYGPDVLGIAGGSLIVIPRGGMYCRARMEDLETEHPFPFIVG